MDDFEMKLNEERNSIFSKTLLNYMSKKYHFKTRNRIQNKRIGLPNL
jgi:predicted Rossmann fold nucleotide-binding protein DprA/Smf involved in DNA uptake